MKAVWVSFEVRDEEGEIRGVWAGDLPEAPGVGEYITIEGVLGTHHKVMSRRWTIFDGDHLGCVVMLEKR